MLPSWRIGAEAHLKRAPAGYSVRLAHDSCTSIVGDRRPTGMTAPQAGRAAGLQELRALPEDEVGGLLELDADEHRLRLQNESELGLHAALDESRKLRELLRRALAPVRERERVLARQRGPRARELEAFA